MTKAEEIIHTLIYLDKHNQIHFDETEDTTPEAKTLRGVSLSFPYLDTSLEEQAEKKKALEKGELT